MKKTLFTFLFALLFYAQANAQSNDLALLYKSEEDFQPAQLVCNDGSPGLCFESGDVRMFDFDGDGTPDLILEREDEQGNLQDILVIDAQTQVVLWKVLDVPQTLGYIDTGLIRYGFANVVGGDEPEAIFTSDHDVRLYDPSDNTLVWSVTADDDWEFPDPSIKVRLLAAIDFTGDDKKELLIFLPDTKELQVWHEKLP